MSTPNDLAVENEKLKDQVKQLLHINLKNCLCLFRESRELKDEIDNLNVYCRSIEMRLSE